MIGRLKKGETPYLLSEFLEHWQLNLNTRQKRIKADGERAETGIKRHDFLLKAG